MTQVRRSLAGHARRERSRSEYGSLYGPCPLAISLQLDMLKSVKSTEAIEALRALGSEARLAVFRLLVKRGPKGYTPFELVERLGVPAPTLSFHLKELTHAGLVSNRREGRNLFYGPNLVA